jgi:hypothetical protein
MTGPHSERTDAIDALERAKDAAESDDPRRAKSNADAAAALLRVYERRSKAKLPSYADTDDTS